MGSHALPAMPYDPGEQGVPMHSKAPDEGGQEEASSAIFPRAGTAVTPGRSLSRVLATDITNSKEAFLEESFSPASIVYPSIPYDIE
jgi:hypothetical protein